MTWKEFYSVVESLEIRQRDLLKEKIPFIGAGVLLMGFVFYVVFSFRGMGSFSTAYLTIITLVVGNLPKLLTMWTSPELEKLQLEFRAMEALSVIRATP